MTHLADLYPCAKKFVVSDKALGYALLLTNALKRKRPLHREVPNKKYFEPDLLAQRQAALEKIVPEDPTSVELWEWELDQESGKVKWPSRIHLEWLCYGYTPDEDEISDCTQRACRIKLKGIL